MGHGKRQVPEAPASPRPAAGGGSGVATADAFTGPTGAFSSGAAGLLAADSVGRDDGRGLGSCWCVVAGGGPLIAVVYLSSVSHVGARSSLAPQTTGAMVLEGVSAGVLAARGVGIVATSSN